MSELVIRENARAAVEAVGLDPDRLPRHIAIIMDGNGRWAKRHGWLRNRGHRQGAEAVRTVTTESARLGLERLTLYAFSSENWERPQREINYLMKLLEDFLDDELPTLMENNIRFRAIGRLDKLTPGVRNKLIRNRDATANHDGLTLCLALSYGGRDELIDACRSLAAAVAAGELSPDEIDVDQVTAHLYDADAPDVDVLVRTAAEQRISNFLIWQSVYAEYVSVAPCWPDFGVEELHAVLHEYQRRERRFGRLDKD